MCDIVSQPCTAGHHYYKDIKKTSAQGPRHRTDHTYLSEAHSCCVSSVVDNTTDVAALRLHWFSHARLFHILLSVGLRWTTSLSAGNPTQANKFYQPYYGLNGFNRNFSIWYLFLLFKYFNIDFIVLYFMTVLHLKNKDTSVSYMKEFKLSVCADLPKQKFFSVSEKLSSVTDKSRDLELMSVPSKSDAVLELFKCDQEEERHLTHGGGAKHLFSCSIGTAKGCDLNSNNRISFTTAESSTPAICNLSSTCSSSMDSTSINAMSVLDTPSVSTSCPSATLSLEDALCEKETFAFDPVSSAPSPATSEKSGRSSRSSITMATSASRSTRSKESIDFAGKQKTFMTKVQAATVDALVGGDGKSSGGSASPSRSNTPERVGTVKRKRDSSTGSTASTASTGSKKKKAGGKVEEQPAVHTQQQLNDNYCWECHREGEFICCEMCPRVYHLRCADLDAAPPQDWACHVCHTIMLADNVENRSRAMQLVSVEQLATMLKFALKRVWTTQMMEPFTRPVDVSQFPTYSEVVLHPVDFCTLEQSINNRVYGSTEAFVADVTWILHNSVIFNGANSKVTNLARTALKIIKQEMSEIETCPDCYMNAHELPDTWFTEACRLAHPLVWARLKGFPYWPAKAVKWHNSSVDVRFFGRHDRSWVSSKDCYLLSEKMPVVLKNRNRTLEACMTEVTEHIARLKGRFGDFVYAGHRVPFSPSDPDQVRLLLPHYTGPPLSLLHTLNAGGTQKQPSSDDETSSIGSTDSGSSLRRVIKCKEALESHMDEKESEEISTEVQNQETAVESERIESPTEEEDAEEEPNLQTEIMEGNASIVDGKSAGTAQDNNSDEVDEETERRLLEETIEEQEEKERLRELEEKKMHIKILEEEGELHRKYEEEKVCHRNEEEEKKFLSKTDYEEEFPLELEEEACLSELEEDEDLLEEELEDLREEEAVLGSESAFLEDAKGEGSKDYLPRSKKEGFMLHDGCTTEGSSELMQGKEKQSDEKCYEQPSNDNLEYSEESVPDKKGDRETPSNTSSTNVSGGINVNYLEQSLLEFDREQEAKAKSVPGTNEVVRASVIAPVMSISSASTCPPSSRSSHSETLVSDTLEFSFESSLNDPESPQAYNKSEAVTVVVVTGALKEAEGGSGAQLGGSKSGADGSSSGSQNGARDMEGREDRNGGSDGEQQRNEGNGDDGDDGEEEGGDRGGGKSKQREDGEEMSEEDEDDEEDLEDEENDDGERTLMNSALTIRKIDMNTDSCKMTNTRERNASKSPMSSTPTSVTTNFGSLSISSTNPLLGTSISICSAVVAPVLTSNSDSISSIGGSKRKMIDMQYDDDDEDDNHNKQIKREDNELDDVEEDREIDGDSHKDDEEEATRSTPESQKQLDLQTSVIESQLGSSISFTLRNSSSLTIKDFKKSSSEDKNKGSDSNSKRTNSSERSSNNTILKGVDFKRMSASNDKNEREGSGVSSRRSSTDGNSDSVAHNISRISKGVSVSTVSTKTSSKDTCREDADKDSVSPDSALCSSLAELGSSISISKAPSSASISKSTASLPASISISSVSSSVSVIKNLESERSDRTSRSATEKQQQQQKSSGPSSADEEDSTSASRLLETSMKASREIPNLMQLSRDVDVKPLVDVKPVLNEKGVVVVSNSGVTKTQQSSCSASGSSKDKSGQTNENSSCNKNNLPAGVDTSKLNSSISIIAVSSSAERTKATSTTASSRPSSGTSAHSTSTSPGSSTSPAVANITVRDQRTLQDNSSHSNNSNTSNVPPPPPLSQPSQSSPSMNRGGAGGFPGLGGMPGLGPSMRGGPLGGGMRGLAPNMMMGGSARLSCPPLRGGQQQGNHLPPEAGPLSQQLHQHSHKLAELMRASLEEVLAGLVVAGTPEARVAALQLELERSGWRHQQELVEVRHNADIMLGEMRASMEAERHRAVEEVRRSMEQQQAEHRRQMERRLSEKISEVKRQCDVERQRAVEETKKKQWCANCGKEALFFCCWNTSYCDYPCQQAHWPQHMSVCGQNSDTNGGGAGGATNTSINNNGLPSSMADGGGTSGESLNGDMSGHSSRVSTPLHGLMSQNPSPGTIFPSTGAGGADLSPPCPSSVPVPTMAQQHHMQAMGHMGIRGGMGGGLGSGMMGGPAMAAMAAMASGSAGQGGMKIPTRYMPPGMLQQQMYTSLEQRSLLLMMGGGGSGRSHGPPPAHHPPPGATPMMRPPMHFRPRFM